MHGGRKRCHWTVQKISRQWGSVRRVNGVWNGVGFVLGARGISVFGGEELPLEEAPDRARYVRGSLDVENCSQWQRARTWSYYYTTPTECRRAATQQATQPRSQIALSPRYNEMWILEDRKLLHQLEGTTEGVETPYREILALAPAQESGGVWIATEEGLIYGRVSTDDEGEKSPPNVTFRPFLVNPRPAPDRAYTLIIDRTDRVWTLPQADYLSYLDEASQVWHQVDYPRYRMNSITASPVHGIWGVGCLMISPTLMA